MLKEHIKYVLTVPILKHFEKLSQWYQLHIYWNIKTNKNKELHKMQFNSPTQMTSNVVIFYLEMTGIN